MWHNVLGCATERIFLTNQEACRLLDKAKVARIPFPILKPYTLHFEKNTEFFFYVPVLKKKVKWSDNSKSIHITYLFLFISLPSEKSLHRETENQDDARLTETSTVDVPLCTKETGILGSFTYQLTLDREGGSGQCCQHNVIYCYCLPAFYG